MWSRAGLLACRRRLSSAGGPAAEASIDLEYDNGESPLRTSMPQSGWCTVVHFRTLHRRGFLKPEFLAQYRDQEDFVVQMNDPLTHSDRALFREGSASDGCFTGSGLLGHPGRGCFWYLFDHVQSLHPRQLLSRLRLGEHYNEGFLLVHVSPDLLPDCRTPSAADYAHTVGRIDPQLVPELDVGRFGTLISIDYEAGLVHGIAEAVTDCKDLASTDCECFWIRPAMLLREPVARTGFAAALPDGLAVKDAIRLYLSDTLYYGNGDDEGWRWSGSYHETGPEEGLWRLRYLAQGTAEEQHIYDVLEQLAAEPDCRLSEPAQQALRDFGRATG